MGESDTDTLGGGETVFETCEPCRGVRSAFAGPGFGTCDPWRGVSSTLLGTAGGAPGDSSTAVVL